MISNRLSELWNEASRTSVDAMIISPGPNLGYLCGFMINPRERTFLLLLGPKGSSSVFPKLEEKRVTASLGGEVMSFPYRDEDGPVDSIKGALEAAGIDRQGRITLAVEYLQMRVNELKMVNDAIEGYEMADLGKLFSKLRVNKDENERAYTRKAAAIVDIGIDEARRRIKPGVSERYVAARIEEAMRQAGADSIPFNKVLSGLKAANPHGNPDDKLIEEGDLVICDIGATYRGYTADITRTLAAGTPSAMLKRMHSIVCASNEAGRMSARPGLTCSELDAICRNVIAAEGLDEYFIHRTGHGLGLEVHEDPYIVSGNNMLLSPGMVFTIEPGVYIPEVGGVRIEDDVIITEEGVEVITKSKRELDI